MSPLWKLLAQFLAASILILTGVRIGTFRWEAVNIAVTLAWVVAIPVGTVVELDMVWLIADPLNAFMAIPNLIALLLLAPLVFGITREYFKR